MFLFYRDLSKHLGEDQPFYGIQARRLGGRQVGHATVEEMAEFYIKEMQTASARRSILYRRFVFRRAWRLLKLLKNFIKKVKKLLC